MVGLDRIADGDVSGDALTESESAEDAERSREFRLAVDAFDLGVVGWLWMELDDRLVGDCHTGTVAVEPGVIAGWHDVGVSNASRPVIPASIAAPAAAYAHAVVTESARRWLHTSGVVPIAPDGSVPSDLADQAAVVWSNISAMLSDAGMSVTDIVSVTTYAVVGEDLAPVMAARDDALGGHLAASTLVTVPALARPEWRMEIAVVAAAD